MLQPRNLKYMISPAAAHTYICNISWYLWCVYKWSTWNWKITNDSPASEVNCSSAFIRFTASMLKRLFIIKTLLRNETHFIDICIYRARWHKEKTVSILIDSHLREIIFNAHWKTQCDWIMARTRNNENRIIFTNLDSLTWFCVCWALASVDVLGHVIVLTYWGKRNATIMKTSMEKCEKKIYIFEAS